MWTFDNPPLKQWKERYNFEPSKEWLDKLRLASVKFPGASGVFVSPNGLIATNHHVASGFIERLSSKERDLLKNGFYAKTQADELKVPDGNVSILQSYDNVTDRVHGAAKGRDRCRHGGKTHRRDRGDREGLSRPDCGARSFRFIAEESTGCTGSNATPTSVS